MYRPVNHGYIAVSYTHLIEGENLDMGKLSLDESIITVEGTINSIVYSKERKPQESFIKRLFK